MDRRHLNAQVAQAADIPRRTFIIGTLVTVVVTLASIAAVSFVLLARLTDISVTNRANILATKASQALLVDCVTPGPNPAPTTGHPCWDRLHDPHGSDAAIAVIVDDIYCAQRRVVAHLPPVPDVRVPCRDQTDPAVYPGGN